MKFLVTFGLIQSIFYLIMFFSSVYIYFYSTLTNSEAFKSRDLEESIFDLLIHHHFTKEIENNEEEMVRNIDDIKRQYVNTQL